jgi:hypothetical protein
VPRPLRTQLVEQTLLAQPVAAMVKRSERIHSVQRGTTKAILGVQILSARPVAATEATTERTRLEPPEITTATRGAQIHLALRAVVTVQRAAQTPSAQCAVTNK